MDRALGNGRCCVQAAFAIARRLSGEARRSDIHPFAAETLSGQPSSFACIQDHPLIDPGTGSSRGASKEHIIALHGCYDGKTNEGYKILAWISRKRSKTNEIGQRFDSRQAPLFRLIWRADTDVRGKCRRCVLEWWREIQPRALPEPSVLGRDGGARRASSGRPPCPELLEE